MLGETTASPAGDGADRGEQSVGRHVLEQEAAGAGPQRGERVLVEVEGGQDDARRERTAGARSAGWPRRRPCPACARPSARRRAWSSGASDRLSPSAASPTTARSSAARRGPGGRPVRSSSWSSTSRTRMLTAPADPPAGRRERGVHPPAAARPGPLQRCRRRPPRAPACRSARPRRPGRGRGRCPSSLTSTSMQSSRASRR